LGVHLLAEKNDCCVAGVFFSSLFLFRLQRNECADAEKIFFFFLSIVRTVSTEERTGEKKNKKKNVGSHSSLQRLSFSRLYVVEGVSGGHTFFARSSFFFFLLLPLHFFLSTQMDSRSTDTIALAFLRFLIYPFPSHHHRCL
jgi:hypothetical protein